MAQLDVGDEMTSCELELNIRLDIRGEQMSNDIGFLKREDHVLTRVSALALEATVESRRCDFPEAGPLVPCLAIHLRGHQLNKVDWAKLANELEQDCIAVWDVTNATGSLFGPRAMLWTPFDFQEFRRFKLDLQQATLHRLTMGR